MIVENGFGEYNFGILEAGNYLVTATYPGDLNHKANSSSVNLNVAKLTPNITLNVSDITWGETEVITITSDIYCFVNVTVNNMTVTLDLDGQTRYLLAAALNDELYSGYKATLHLSNLNSGSYPVTVVFDGDENLETTIISGEFKVNALNATINTDVNDISVGDTETITVILPDDATGTVTATIDGKDYTAPVENGKATFNIQGLTPGKYEITVIYSGDGKYNPIQDKSNVIVKDNGAKDENKTTDKVTPDKKVIKATDKIMPKATGNPIFVLLLMLMTIGITTLRRF